MKAAAYSLVRPWRYGVIIGGALGARLRPRTALLCEQAVLDLHIYAWAALCFQQCVSSASSNACLGGAAPDHSDARVLFPKTRNCCDSHACLQCLHTVKGAISGCRRARCTRGCASLPARVGNTCKHIPGSVVQVAGVGTCKLWSPAGS